VGECLARAELKFPRKVEAMGREDARDLVRKAVAKAKSHSLLYEGEVFAMVDLVFEHGLDFDTREELADTFGVLHDTSLTPDARMGLIAARLEAAAVPYTP
jgi:hypothetical protein